MPIGCSGPPIRHPASSRYLTITRRLPVGLLPAVLAALGCEPAAPTSPDSTAPRHTFAAETVGFLTSSSAQARLTAGTPGSITPLVTVGDRMPGSGLPFAPLPDGIALYGGTRHVSVMLNHELDGVRTRSGHEDFLFARVSRLTIDTKTLEVIAHEYVLDGTEGYVRLCSAAWVDARDGFPGGYFFAGEERDDGLQLAIDRTGRVTEMPWIGRYAHENQIAVPGFPGHVVLLNFDDNAGSGVGVRASESELYMYVARNGKSALTGRGQLYVFRSDAALHPGRLQVGEAIVGSWLPVPDAVARDAGALERYGDENGAFPFTRLEDGFYDKRPGTRPAVYFFDTGSGGLIDEDGALWDPWGSIYRLEFLNPRDPAGSEVTLTLVARSQGPDRGWASPDNGDMTADGVLMLQEDPSNGPWERRPAIYRFEVAFDGSLTDSRGRAVVELQDPDDPTDASLVYGWETSGIVDASEWFGPGAWIFDVQAHDKSVPSLDLAEDNGQLLLLRLR